MAEYTIPEAQQPPLNLLRTISDAAFSELASGLEQSPDDLPRIDGIPEGDASSVKDAVMELYRVREFFEEDLDDFVPEIAVALREAVKFPIEETDQFQDRLKKVLSIGTLGIAAKAASLKLEFERRFCSARIVTDARPVYLGSPSKPPSAVMVTHTLRVSFHDNTSELREIYISLDDDDLITLRQLIDRAEAKAHSLRSVFDAARIKIVVP
ncbi:MAG: hypothetical protein ACLQG3_18520 [Terracidiphilus sp.]